MNDNDSGADWLSFFAGIGVGALVGAAAALLLAPQTGADTRTQIRTTATDVAGRLGDAAGDVATNIQDRLASLQGKVDELIARTRHTAEATQAAAAAAGETLTAPDTSIDSAPAV